LLTSTPERCTSSGRLAVASWSLFWTLDQAMSGSVPGSKVSSSLAWPEEELSPLRYKSPSRPVIFCSMIWVTVFSTVSAEAPGK
jgi:hypothetical protein